MTGRLEGLLAIVGLKVMMEGVRTGITTDSKSCWLQCVIFATHFMHQWKARVYHQYLRKTDGQWWVSFVNNTDHWSMSTVVERIHVWHLPVQTRMVLDFVSPVCGANWTGTSEIHTQQLADRPKIQIYSEELEDSFTAQHVLAEGS